ncbi:hypothetical protein AC578_6910 [Pseudocercospora eumusae]|uniref:BZIP domain-containing protein n=1 Tax=Pseudocercospora eumusae TaxID=321146 RepID=A0A139H2L3_9PEZI|nr:hypothetical protein AC578_6910 [Pseudocercospora eumusae]
MTCVLPPTPSWHHFNDHLPWLPMNPDTASSQPSLDRAPSQGYVSPGSETRKSSTSSGKKRASRAGTRSVTTLSAAQLERKRANDREAQRAIRQRTKDHIDHLERTVNDLRGSQEQSEKIVHATQQRNRELEDENAYLRSKLSEAGFNMNLMADNQRSSESTMLSVPSTSPGTASGSSIPRSGSNSTPSNHSVTTQSSGSRHGSWQHPSGFVGTAMSLPSAAAVANAPNMTTWRSHDSAQSLQTPGGSIQDPLQTQTGAPYHHGEYANPSSYQYVSQDQQRPQYETAPAHQQPNYQPSAVQAYGASAAPQPSTYQTGLTPQSEYPSLSVSTSPSTYAQPSFQQPASFQVSPLPVPASATEYTSPHGQMQPPPLPNPSFHPSGSEQNYGPGQAAPPMQYRDENASRSYSLSHYPTA